MLSAEFKPEILDKAIWYFNERERIRLLKESDAPKPWTKDIILQHYSFTNILRRHDKTSQFFIQKHYQPNYDAPFKEAILNATILRYFGSIAFAEEHQWVTLEILNDPVRLEKQLQDTYDRVVAKGEKPFTSAYVVTNMGMRLPKQEIVIQRFVLPLALELDRLEAVYEAHGKKWRPLAEFMIKNLTGFADFMTKEVLQDVIYTNVLAGYEDSLEWTPVGPGAIKGMNWLLGNKLTDPAGKSLERMKVFREILLEKAEPHMTPILGEFDLHGAQVLQCELQKYFRTHFGEGKPKRKYPGYATR